MKDILVVQLCRHGDLLQSTPALTALRKRWPRARIAVLTRRAFGHVLAGNPDVDEVIEWDAAPLAQEWRGRSFHDRMSALRALVGPLRARHFGMVCNFSNDVPSALLTYLMRPGRALGLTFCRDRHYRVKDEWFRYLFHATEVRSFHAVNLVDIFIRACGGEGPLPLRIQVSKEDLHFAELKVREQFGDTPLRPVAMRIGAGRERGRWLPDLFHEVARRLAKEGRPVLFIGSAAEGRELASIADRLNESDGRVLNLVGEMSYSQEAALLQQCDLLLSDEASAVHLAAAVNTRVLALSFGASSAWDSAPYGEGHYVLEPVLPCHPCAWNAQCSRFECRDQLSIEILSAAARHALKPEGGATPALHAAPIALHRTEWMSDGFLGLRPVNRPALRLRDILRTLFRAHYLSRLSAGTPAAPPDGPGIDLDDYRMEDPLLLADEALSAARDVAALARLAREGEDAASAVFNLRSNAAPAEGRDRADEAFSKREQQIISLEGNEILRFLVAGFRHALIDMEARDAHESAAVHRWNCRRLAESCEFVGRGLKNAASALRERARTSSEIPAPAGSLSSALVGD